MSEPKITTEQDLIDKGAFPEYGALPFEEPRKDGKPINSASHGLCWDIKANGVFSINQKEALKVQQAVWHAALHWERTSPFSASNKRIKALEGIIE